MVYTFLTWALNGGGWSTPRSVHYTVGKKTRYPFSKRVDEPQDCSGRVRKISYPQGFDPRTVQSVTNRYTDWAISTPNIARWGNTKYWFSRFLVSRTINVCCLSCYVRHSASNVVTSTRHKKMGVAASMSPGQFVRPHEKAICCITAGVSFKNSVLVHVHKQVPKEQVSLNLVG